MVLNMSWIIFIFIAILVVVGIRKTMREAELGRDAPLSSVKPRASKSKPSTQKSVAQETEQCPVCQAYVVQGRKACEKPQCPYPKGKETGE
jgi:hypothetical protein